MKTNNLMKLVYDGEKLIRIENFSLTFIQRLKLLICFWHPINLHFCGKLLKTKDVKA